MNLVCTCGASIPLPFKHIQNGLRSRQCENKNFDLKHTWYGVKRVRQIAILNNKNVNGIIDCAAITVVIIKHNNKAIWRYGTLYFVWYPSKFYCKHVWKIKEHRFFEISKICHKSAYTMLGSQKKTTNKHIIYILYWFNFVRVWYAMQEHWTCIHIYIFLFCVPNQFIRFTYSHTNTNSLLESYSHELYKFIHSTTDRNRYLSKLSY